jgi:hypothetical protein
LYLMSVSHVSDPVQVLRRTVICGSARGALLKPGTPQTALRPPCGIPTRSTELGCKTSFVPSATPGRLYEKSSREEWRRVSLCPFRRVFGPRALASRSPAA